MSEAIKNLFNEISPTYDRLNHLLSLNVDKRWREKAIQSLNLPRASPLVALDLCAGTLDLTLTFLKRFPQAHVHALDFSQAMLEKGEKKIPPTLKKQVSIHCADALNLPFPENIFDVVFCGYGFRNLDDKEKGLQEIKKVLKPGGQVLILDFFRPTHWFSQAFHSSYGKILLPLAGKWISGHAHAYQYLHDSVGNFMSTHTLNVLLNKNGFKNILVNDYLFGISSLVLGIKA